MKTEKLGLLGEIHDIELKQIHVSDDNVRHHDPTKDLQELADSIKRHGLLQPVVLKGEYGNPPYELIGGQRRFLAHQKILKWPKIRAVFAGKLTQNQAVVRSLVENLQRVQLSYEDTARAVTFLYEKLGDDRKVHEETGLSLRKVRDFILIEAQATRAMKSALKQNKVKPADVKRAIQAAQGNLDKAEELVELIIKHKPTTHQKARLVKYGEASKSASAQKILKEAMKPHVEQSLIIALPEEIRKALEKATTSLEMDPAELAAKVLGDWLRSEGFAE
jgi:ParB family transcriptional regulator, chromosome partitioning protein